jgi:hypothetical protein
MPFCRRISASFHCGSPAIITGCVGSIGAVALSAPRNVAAPEDGRINGHEEMSNVRADGLLGVLRIGDERRARQAGREDIHHHCKAVALVAGILRRAAERGQESALLLGH